MIFRLRSGQMLVELVMALGVAMIVLVALVSVTTQSIGSSRYSKEQSEATGLATQAVDWLRREKGIDWKVFYARGGSYCLDNLAWSPPAPCPAVGTTIYTRTLAVTSSTTDGIAQVTAVITVSWAENRQTFSVNQTIVFSRY